MNKDIKHIINLINAEKRIAEKDLEMSTAPEDYQYHAGLCDGLTTAKRFIKEELEI